MTFEEQRRLALQAEIEKLRAIARQVDRLSVDAHTVADRLDNSVSRFQAILDAGDVVDQKINALEMLHKERRKVAETKGELRGTIVDITRTLGGL
jgi:uncharacterized membrane protein